MIHIFIYRYNYNNYAFSKLDFKLCIMYIFLKWIYFRKYVIVVKLLLQLCNVLHYITHTFRLDCTLSK